MGRLIACTLLLLTVFVAVLVAMSMWLETH